MAEIDLFSVWSMTRRVNQIIPTPQFFLDMFYPLNPRDVHETRSFLVDIYKNGQKMAPFVHECLPATVQQRDPYDTHTITPPYIKKMRDLKGCDLGDRHVGEALFSTESALSRIQTVQENDMTEMDAEIDRREEWMAVRQLTHDTIPLRGDGVNADINILFSSSHKITASTTWATLTGDAPVTDLETAQGLTAASGYTATDAIFGKVAWGRFRRNAGVLQQLDVRNINGNQLQAALITTGAVFRGEMNGLRLWTYFAQYPDDTSGVLTPFIPDDMVLIGSTGGDGRRHYGMIQDLDAPGGAQVRRFSKSWRTPNPSAQYTLVQTSPMPLMHTPDAWVRLDTTP